MRALPGTDGDVLEEVRLERVSSPSRAPRTALALTDESCAVSVSTALGTFLQAIWIVNPLRLPVGSAASAFPVARPMARAALFCRQT